MTAVESNPLAILTFMARRRFSPMPICGGALLVRETRLALVTIHEEARFYRTRYFQK